MKYDNGKPSLSLLPVEPVLEVAKVFGFGAEKYGRNNWREDGGETSWLRTYDSIQRHLTSWLNGENLDPESGESHLAHAMCQMLILRQHMMDGHTKMDNRYKDPNNVVNDGYPYFNGSPTNAGLDDIVGPTDFR